MCSEGASFAPLAGTASTGLCVFDTFGNSSKAVLNTNRFKSKRCLDNTSFQKALHRGEVFPRGSAQLSLPGAELGPPLPSLSTREWCCFSHG